MPAKVLLKDIVDALEMQFDEYPSFVDLDRGTVDTISRDALRAAEEPDEDEIADGEDEESELAQRILFTGNFRKLPTAFDVHEWAIMKDFSESVQSNRVREDLEETIHGTGAFRSFKREIHRHGIEQDCYAFRSESLRQIAIDWCEENEIAWQ